MHNSIGKLGNTTPRLMQKCMYRGHGVGDIQEVTRQLTCATKHKAVHLSTLDGEGYTFMLTIF